MSKQTGLNLDLTQFNKTSHGFLKEKEVSKKKESKIVSDGVMEKTLRNTKVVKSQPVEKGEDKKLGRPMIENELLNKKLIASVTETEYGKIIKDAGLVSVSTYLRTKMREAGII
jgi:hypothetical protein